MYLNKVTLIGFTGANGQQKFTPAGKQYCRLSLATKRSWKAAEASEWQERTEWHNVISWGKLAEAAARLQAGAHVLVEGEVRSREYDKDGVKHRVSEIYADTIKSLDRANGRAEEPAVADSPVCEEDVPA
jgi:single-strand DNA-binding protein